jgi:hypothetical protein
MLQDHKKLLYPNCEDGQKKLGSTLTLLRWKAENGVTDWGFNKLLIMMKELLPRDNELPASTYEAKKVVYPLGLDVQKIHACPNDCILYHGEEYDNCIHQLSKTTAFKELYFPKCSLKKCSSVYRYLRCHHGTANAIRPFLGSSCSCRTALLEYVP